MTFRRDTPGKRPVTLYGGPMGIRRQEQKKQASACTGDWWRGGERGRSLRERTPPAQWPLVRQRSYGEYTFTRCLLGPPPSKGPLTFCAHSLAVRQSASR